MKKQIIVLEVISDLDSPDQDLLRDLDEKNWCINIVGKLDLGELKDSSFPPEQETPELYCIYETYNDSEEKYFVPLTSDQADLIYDILNYAVSGTHYNVEPISEILTTLKVTSLKSFAEDFLLLGHEKEEIINDDIYINRDGYLKLFELIEE